MNMNEGDCRRRAHRYPNAVINYKTEAGESKIIVSSNASENGVLFGQEPPDDFQNASQYEIFFNGNVFYTDEVRRLPQDRKRPEECVFTYRSSNDRSRFDIEEEREKNTRLLVGALRSRVKEDSQEALKSLGTGKINIPLNKIRFGLLVMCGILAFVMIVLPVTRILFGGLSLESPIPQLLKATLVGGLVCSAVFLGLLVFFAVRKKRAESPGGEQDGGFEMQILSVFGVAGFLSLVLPLLVTLFGSQEKLETQQHSVPLYGVILGAGVVGVVSLAVVIARLQKGLNEYVRNDSRIAYLNYCNQMMLALSMSVYSEDSLKRALEESRKAGEQLLGVVYRQ